MPRYDGALRTSLRTFTDRLEHRARVAIRFDRILDSKTDAAHTSMDVGLDLGSTTCCMSSRK